MLHQLVAVLLMAGLAQSYNSPCLNDSECMGNQICNGADATDGNAGINGTDNSHRSDENILVQGNCDCPGELVLSLYGECLPVGYPGGTYRKCVVDDDCVQPNERCSASPTLVDHNGPVLVCTCLESHWLDPKVGECRRRPCEDYCFATGGDTCRNDECLRCWANDEFQCNQFLPPTDPTIIFYRRSSFFSVWVLTFFFLMTVLLLFSCVWKCCLQRGMTSRPQRLAAQRQFVERQQQQQQQTDQRDQYDQVNIKMPLDVAALYVSNNHQQLRTELPPPYAAASSTA